ncbi:putative ABC transporter ATP-binding protein YlmA [Poriferisphaera corsica]|uniref:Putative ABC transporter ATP-binding protein YlmA n=1 Tax=Poriferisphaera corsica TaxID=2528020 RepID=A0A517YR35_9BACT|nr:ATP-binding cassette domain-containing protein [Poriferisphaera corsica]QDU32682.1 putative ABC transporter ATP-binding protein YlmA [Poriferisphaera corsica]
MSNPQETFAIQAHNLTIQRGNTTILNNLNCTIKAGQAVAILGPNGCGKTTFARTILGHIFPTSGSLQILGRTIGETNIPKLRKHIGIVNPTTDTSSIHTTGAIVDARLSTLQAVCTGFFATIGLYDTPSPTQIETASQYLHAVGLSHRQDHRFATLSTGEQRRALIARALVHHPQLLILDEPTAGLDIAGREQILATIEMILAKPNPPALIMITHHVEELSPRTSNVFLMRDGQFINQGPPSDIITPESLTQTFGCKVFVKKIHGRFWLEVLPEAWLDLV